MFGLGEIGGVLGAIVVFGLILVGLYLLILSILLPYFVYKMYLDVAEIKKHMLGISYDINTTMNKVSSMK